MLNVILVILHLVIVLAFFYISVFVHVFVFHTFRFRLRLATTSKDAQWWIAEQVRRFLALIGEGRILRVREKFFIFCRSRWSRNTRVQAEIIGSLCEFLEGAKKILDHALCVGIRQVDFGHRRRKRIYEVLLIHDLANHLVRQSVHIRDVSRGPRSFLLKQSVEQIG